MIKYTEVVKIHKITMKNMLKSENIYDSIDKITVEIYNKEKQMYPTDRNNKKINNK